MNPRAALPLALALITGCQQEVADQAPPPLRPVRYSSVEAVEAGRARIFAGAAAAAVQSRLSFKVSGTIVDLPVEVGDSVREGQVIARIDPVDYQLSLEGSQAALADAVAQLRNAEATFQRVRALFERDSMSQNDYDAARAAVQSARAGVRSVQKQLEQARLQVEHCTLEAPVAGQVASVNVEVNENVQTGNPVVMLNSAATPEVVVGIPELLIGELRRGARVENIAFTALPGRTVSGLVREISPTAAEGTTNLPGPHQAHVRRQRNPARHGGRGSSSASENHRVRSGWSSLPRPSARTVRGVSSGSCQACRTARRPSLADPSTRLPWSPAANRARSK